MDLHHRRRPNRSRRNHGLLPPRPLPGRRAREILELPEQARNRFHHCPRERRQSRRGRRTLQSREVLEARPRSQGLGLRYVLLLLDDCVVCSGLLLAHYPSGRHGF